MKKLVIAISVLSGLLLIFGALMILDIAMKGPYVVHYNNKCKRLVTDHHLIGEPLANVIKVLGNPSYCTVADEKGSLTLNYAPYSSLFPYAKFQAHFTSSVLTSIELYDD